MNKKNMQNYYKCDCGSSSFIKVYTVWNVEIKVEVSEYNNEECWDEEIIGKEKDHFDGYICKKCRKSMTELNDIL
jgi:hypothetical protein